MDGDGNSPNPSSSSPASLPCPCPFEFPFARESPTSLFELLNILDLLECERESDACPPLSWMYIDNLAQLLSGRIGGGGRGDER